MKALPCRAGAGGACCICRGTPEDRAQGASVRSSRAFRIRAAGRTLRAECGGPCARAGLCPSRHDAAEQARAARGKLTCCSANSDRCRSQERRAGAARLPIFSARGGWRWGKAVVACVGEIEKLSSPIGGLPRCPGVDCRNGRDEAPPAKPSSIPVEAGETRARLEQLIGIGGETRSEQAAYAEAAAYAFAPRERPGAPKIALIEAGTGIGKTLGYLAPASLWAEKNGAGLWVSTYTRNLQRQLVQELARLYPDPVEREEKAVVRKGPRELSFAFLNFPRKLRSGRRWRQGNVWWRSASSRAGYRRRRTAICPARAFRHSLAASRAFMR